MSVCVIYIMFCCCCNYRQGAQFGSTTQMFKSTIGKLGDMMTSGNSNHMYYLIFFVVFVFLVLYYLMSRKWSYLLWPLFFKFYDNIISPKFQWLRPYNVHCKILLFLILKDCAMCIQIRSWYRQIYTKEKPHKMCLLYTLYLGLVLPAIKSAVCATTGRSNMLLRIGTWRPTVSTVGKKFPNRFRKPNPSRHIPISPHRKRTRAIPAKKQMVPRILSRLNTIENGKRSWRKCLWQKMKIKNWTHLVNKFNARLNPMAKQRPARNKVFPIAIRLRWD
jgi:hypothetical protein